jgi:hypothetical protein
VAVDATEGGGGGRGSGGGGGAGGVRCIVERDRVSECVKAGRFFDMARLNSGCSTKYSPKVYWSS